MALRYILLRNARFDEMWLPGVGVLLTSADQLFPEIEAAYRRWSATASEGRNYWMQIDFYE